jgi:ferredoxin
VEEKKVPKLEVEGVGTFDVDEGKRLVLAIEEDVGVDIMHECGGYARCTTCRVEFLEGEPETMTQAELAMLVMRSLLEGVMNFGPGTIASWYGYSKTIPKRRF